MAQVQPSQQQQQGFDNAKLYMWVKGLEGKVNNLLREVDLIKNDFLHKVDTLKTEVKTLNGEIVELKHTQERDSQKMDLIIKELKKTAGREDVATLQKYVDFWNPMSFVTQRDLERAVEAKVHSNGKNTEEPEII
jgi:hypothetical protein